MTEKMVALRARQAKKSRQNKAKSLLPPVEATVPMPVYLKALDEKNLWRNQAVDAEARLCRSGDVLGEGRLDLLKGSSNANNRS
jgi:hypothetical protein